MAPLTASFAYARKTVFTFIIFTKLLYFTLGHMYMILKWHFFLLLKNKHLVEVFQPVQDVQIELARVRPGLMIRLLTFRKVLQESTESEIIL